MCSVVLNCFPLGRQNSCKIKWISKKSVDFILSLIFASSISLNDLMTLVERDPVESKQRIEDNKFACTYSGYSLNFLNQWVHKSIQILH